MKYASQEPFDSRCRCWRPDVDHVTVAGSIAFDGDRIRLELDEWFEESLRVALDLPRFEVLYGETTDGTAFTLHDGFVQKAHSSGFDVVVNHLLMGEHVCDDQTYLAGTARLSGLEEWMDVRALTTERDESRLYISCASPKTVEVRVSARGATVVFGQVREYRDTIRSVEVEYSSYLRVQADSPRSRQWFDSLIHALRQLLSLWMNASVRCESLRLRLVGRDDVASIQSLVRHEVETFWNPRQSSVDPVKWYEIPFSLATVEAQLEDCVNRWLSDAEELQHVRGLLFSSTESPAPFIESRFLPLVQAVEVYHRLQSDSKFLDAAKFDVVKTALFDSIPAGLPRPFVGKIKTSVGFANEFGLKARILSLLETLTPSLQNLVCKNPDIFAKWLSRTRNHFTHYGDESKCLTGVQLHWATHQASLLLRIHMLLRVGIDADLLGEKLGSLYSLAQAIKIWHGIEAELD